MNNIFFYCYLPHGYMIEELLNRENVRMDAWVHAQTKYIIIFHIKLQSFDKLKQRTREISLAVTINKGVYKETIDINLNRSQHVLGITQSPLK